MVLLLTCLSIINSSLDIWTQHIWPEIIETGNTTSGSTVNALRKLFASYGLLQQVVTDDGPQFMSAESTIFMKHNGVKHIKCLPCHPSSNGAAEHFIQTFKRAIKAAEQQGKSERICEFLLTYRNTPHMTTNEMPSMLFLKQLRTRFEKRTRGLARRLADDPHLLQTYGKIICDHLKRGFIEKVTTSPSDIAHYIPHHPVKK